MRAISRALQDAWLAFVRDGSDGLERGGWSEYELHSNKARNFGLNVPMQNFNLSSLEVQCDGADFLYYVDGTAGRYGST